MARKKEMCSFKNNEPGAGIVLVKVSELHDFKGHPFKVEKNQELFELRQRMEKEGVLVPLIIRYSPDGDGYEIVAGHRRKAAAIWTGMEEVPAVIRESITSAEQRRLEEQKRIDEQAEQERLEKEIKDVRDQNSELQVQVNKSSVEAVDEACKKQREAEKQLHLARCQAEQNRKKAQKEIQKLKKEIKLQSEKIKEIKLFCGIGYIMVVVFAVCIIGICFL